MQALTLLKASLISRSVLNHAFQERLPSERPNTSHNVQSQHWPRSLGVYPVSPPHDWRMFRRFNSYRMHANGTSDTTDPISLQYSDDDINEWLTEGTDDEDSHDHVVTQADLVFNDDYFIRGDVARSSRAEEPRFNTRARARARAS